MQVLRDGLPGLQDRLARSGVRLCAGEPYLQRLHASAEGRAINGGDCAPGEKLLFIDEFGRIAPCSFTNDSYGVALAEVRDIKSLPARFAVARLESPSSACEDCHATHVFSKFASCP
jgi:AdoMet-dependent heme synthase